MRFSIPLSFLILLLPFISLATTIECTNPEYAGKLLKFHKIEDPISGNSELFFELKFDNDGHCTINQEVKQTTYVYSDFGIYRGMLFLEPGKTLKLKLPPFRKKSFANQKNPYFKPIDFWFITESKSCLNDKISAYEQRLNHLSNKHFNDLYFKQSKEVYDSVQAQLKLVLPQENSSTYKLHKTLQEKLMEADIFRLKPEDYSRVFETIEPAYWTHPAFIACFEKTFNNQLSFSAKALKGKFIYTAIQQKNISELVKFVSNKYKVTGKMADLVLLKLLHDGFYSGDFAEKTISELVANPRFSSHKNALIKSTAENILEKFSFLRAGNKAPVICLNNTSDERVCTNSKGDKFKYIIFADIETSICREHLKYLSKIDASFNKHLDIYLILRNADKKEISEFLQANQIPGIKLIDSSGKFAETYKIRSYPLSFLLNEKHEVVFNDTKTPLNGFEQQFGTWLRNELFMRQRNQSR